MFEPMKITLYGFAHFDRSAKVRWLLEELGLPYENRWIDSEKKENEGADFLKINPLGRIPAIQIDGKNFSESSGICAYLADLYLDKGFAPALTSPDRPLYQQMMYMAASSMDPFIVRVMIIEDIPPGEIFKAKEAPLLAEVRDTSAFLNQMLSKNEFLVANRFSAADICVSYHLAFAMLWPELKVIVDEYPNLTQYLERMKKRPAAEKAKAFSFPG